MATQIAKIAKDTRPHDDVRLEGFRNTPKPRPKLSPGDRLYFRWWRDPSRPVFSLVAAVVMFHGPTVAGAWAGRWGHEIVRRALDAQGATRGVTPCPACKRRLRVPVSAGRLAVTCPRCGHAFDHGPAAAGRASRALPLSPDLQAQVEALRGQRRALAWALGVSVVLGYAAVRVTFSAASDGAVRAAKEAAEAATVGGYAAGFADAREERPFDAGRVFERLREMAKRGGGGATPLHGFPQGFSP